MPRDRLTKVQDIRARLLKQGANLGTVDAFEAAVRELEDAYVATALRDAAGNEDYALGGAIEPGDLLAVANEIENLRS